MDELTMRIHHDKQPGGHDAKLNAALEGTDNAEESLEELLADIAALRGPGSSERHAAAIEGGRQ
jgi:Fe-Mn family superoxide dismutase